MLEDQLCQSPSELRLRLQEPFHYAIIDEAHELRSPVLDVNADCATVSSRRVYHAVDEADSILIDEAKTPMVISAQAAEPSNKYIVAKEVAARCYVWLDMNDCNMQGYASFKPSKAELGSSFITPRIATKQAQYHFGILHKSICSKLGLPYLASIYYCNGRFAPWVNRSWVPSKDVKAKMCSLTDEGIEITLQLLGKSDLYEPSDPWAPFVNSALNAKDCLLYTSPSPRDRG
eukprot:1620509-Amphidinium_carterae.1